MSNLKIKYIKIFPLQKSYIKLSIQLIKNLNRSQKEEVCFTVKLGWINYSDKEEQEKPVS